MTKSDSGLASLDEVEQAFYRAFERGDLAAMMAVWGDGDELLCIHPMGPALRGHEAVEASWRDILSGGVEMRFSIEPVHAYQTADTVVRVVIEHIAVAGGKRVAPMVSTNLYRHTAQGWRLFVHHASPAPEQPHHAPDAGTTMH
jgi:ketosteroid isomerase-like protein